MPAEFEPIGGVIVSWSNNNPYYTFIINIVKHVSNVTEAYVVVDSDSAEDKARYVLSLVEGLELDHVHFIHADYNTIWHRNYGAFGIITPDGKLAFLDAHSSRTRRKKDDDMPKAVAKYFGAELYEWPLLQDGGNTMTDGNGTFFHTTKIYEWNSPGWGSDFPPLSKEKIHDVIAQYTGHDHHIVLPYQSQPYDGTGHLNMFAKLVTPKKILVCRCPEGGYNHKVLEEAYGILKNATNAHGEKFQVIPIPVETNNRRHDLQYANSLIVNGQRGKIVLAPIYGISSDDTAMEIYRTHMPDYEIIGINAAEMIRRNGTVNCVTKTIPLINPMITIETWEPY